MAGPSKTSRPASPTKKSKGQDPPKVEEEATTNGLTEGEEVKPTKSENGEPLYARFFADRNVETGADSKPQSLCEIESCRIDQSRC